MKYNISEDYDFLQKDGNANIPLQDEMDLTCQFIQHHFIDSCDAYMMGRLAQKKESQEVINTTVELSDDLLSICKDLYELLPEGEDKLRMSRKIIAAGLKPLQSPTYVPFKTARKDNVIPIR